MSDPRTDRIFKALADASRRRMLDLLSTRPRTTGELAAAFPRLSRFAVMKHLGVLHRARLVIITREGRNRWNTLNSAPLKDALRRWMGRHEERVADMLLQVRDAAEAPPPRRKSSDGQKGTPP